MNGFWQGRDVFVTGHTGFKGGWLCLMLQALGARVHGYALAPPTEPNLFTLARIGDVLASHHLADIRDAEALAQAMREAKPSVVLHLAAQPLLRLSYDCPVETYATNVMGTVHVLEAARHIPSVQVVLNVTSDKCYENKERGEAYCEDDPMGGYDPYSSSKGCAELVAAAYARSFYQKGTAKLASVRAGNVIGGGDWATDRLMTDLIAALIAGRAPVLRNPSSVRPWQHVLEPLSGYLRAAEYLVQEKPPLPQAWNFGPDEDSEVPVAQVAQALCRLWGGGLAPILQKQEGAPHEAGLLKLDSGKARRELGWHPRWGLEEALGQTALWYKAWQEGEDMQKATLGQIALYQKAGACASF